MLDLLDTVQAWSAWRVEATSELERVPAIMPVSHVLGREPVH
jgi:hypothetical protein